MPSPDSVAALTVLFGNAAESIERTVEAFDNTVRVARSSGRCHHFVLAFGDASPEPLFTDDDLARWQAAAPHLDEVRYVFFGENTGTSRGQNLLAAQTESDAVLLCNPDIQPEGRALTCLLEVLEDEGVGLVEARQLPVEHPRAYDVGTGRTSWGSGACSLVPRELFTRLGGFDEETFFLYCDDVDLSWRIREAGYDVIHQPAAVVFHDKDLSTSGGWIPTEAERYYSAEAALLLAHKWSRDDVVESLVAELSASTEDVHARAVAEFRRRDVAGSLVARHDPGHDVAEFVDGNYAVHRYAL